MTKRLFPNQAEKVKTGFWSLNLNKISNAFFYLLILFLPTQLGKHFWPQFSFVEGLRLDYLSPTLYFTDILIFLIFVFNFKEIFVSLKKAKRINVSIYLLFLISVVFGVLGSVNHMAGLYGIIKVLEFSFLAYYVLRNFKLFDKTILFFCASISIIFESLLSFLQYLGQGSVGGIFYYFGERTFNSQTPGIANASINGQLILRPYATLPHPNVLAGFLIIYSLLLLFLSFKHKYIKPFLFFVIFLASASILLTLGRTAIILWAIYLFILFWLAVFEKYKKAITKGKLFALFLLSMIFLISVYLGFQHTLVVQRFTSMTMTDESVVQREELINQSVAMFEKKPLLGIGLNNFYNGLNFNQIKQNFLLIQPVHNIFLLILSELGIIGLAFFIYLFYRCFSALGVGRKKEGLYLFLMLFSVVFLGMFDHYFLTLEQGQLMLSLVIGISLSYKNSRVF